VLVATKARRFPVAALALAGTVALAALGGCSDEDRAEVSDRAGDVADEAANRASPATDEVRQAAQDAGARA